MKKPLCFCLLLPIQLNTVAMATPFGVYDPRSLSMGGTGVATSTVSDAAFYNPALLAQYAYDEDKGRRSQFVFPSISAQVSRTIEEVSKFKEQDYDGELNTAISAFNASNGAAADAQSVLDAALNLQNGLARISNGPISADINSSFTIAIPSLRQGGAFYYSKRAVGDGRIDKTADDASLLNAYIETMQFLLTGEGTPSPEIYNNGQLVDQSGNLTSTASAGGIVTSEFGLAMAGTFPVYKNNVSLGITPRFVKTETYVVETSASNNFGENRKSSNRWGVTADIGLAKKFANNWNLGITVKNIVPLRYTTSLNTQINIDPQLRAGFAYQTNWGVVSFDMDVMKNNPVGSGDKTQYSLLGAEWDLTWGKLRGGYNYNFSATGVAKKGLFSFGIQLLPFGMLLDVAYADNGVTRAGALQTGFAF